MSTYKTGTVTVTNGSATVVGSGTAWAVALVAGGIFSSAGASVPIASVTDDTHIVLDYNWPGSTAAGAGYSIALENSSAASVVSLNTTLSRVLVQLALAGIHPDLSGTIAERDALTLTVANKGYLFLHAQIGYDLVFYRWTGTSWDGPFLTRGVAGIGSGGTIEGSTHAAASKATPVDADELPLVDSAASFGLKKLTWANLKEGPRGFFYGTNKTTPVDADTFGMLDSAASFAPKYSTWAQIKATLLAAATFTTSLTGPLHIGGTGTGSSLTLQSTSGVGATDFIRFLVGNNGATEGGRFVTGGNFVLGHTASFPSFASLQPRLQVHGTDAGSSGFGFYNWANAAGGGVIFCNKSRGGSQGTRGIVQSGDTVGLMLGCGDDATAFLSAASVGIYIDGTPGTGDMPGRVGINTTPDGSSTSVERLRIDNTGALIHRNNAQTLVTLNSHYQKRQYASGSLPSQVSADEIRSSDVITAALVSDGTQWVSDGVLVTAALTANGTASLPPGYSIADIFFVNSTANAVTGGIKIGTTSGATDVVAAQTVGANGIGHVVNANVLKKLFSTSASQTLFIQAVTAWNGASVKLAFKLEKVF